MAVTKELTEIITITLLPLPLDTTIYFTLTCCRVLLMTTKPLSRAMQDYIQDMAETVYDRALYSKQLKFCNTSELKLIDEFLNQYRPKNQPIQVTAEETWRR